ncbi:MAG: hypothetical protein EXR73_08245 [Myxococcales bacterium]|nr:hypothetical protein [Myxococcales bacterium]
MKRRLTLGLPAALAASLPVLVHAGGAYVGDSGSRAQARAGAVVARADDPMAILHNPAGLVNLGHKEASVGANFVHHRQSFARDGSYETPDDGVAYPWSGDRYPEVKSSTVMPVPYVALGGRRGRVAVALGVFGPQGNPLRSVPETVMTPEGTPGAPSPARYDILEQEVSLAYPSLAVAYAVSKRLSVGARASWGFGSISARSYTWGITNQEEDQQKDGAFSIDVQDNFIPAWGAGLLFRASSALELGVAFDSGSHFGGSGVGITSLGPKLGLAGELDYIDPVDDRFVQCATGGVLGGIAACLDLDLPMFATAGARFIFRDAAGRERGDLELDLRWEQWSAASDTVVTVDGQSHLTGIYLNPTIIKHGFDDVLSARLGGSASVGRVDLSAGVAYETAAAPTSWNRLDLDGSSRLLGSFGVGVRVGRWQIDAGAAIVVQPDRTVTEVADPSMPPAVADRSQPDGLQPLQGPLNQEYAPINLGKYTSGHLIGMVGVTSRF